MGNSLIYEFRPTGGSHSKISTLGEEDVQTVLEPSRKYLRHLPTDTRVRIAIVEPWTLLIARRFDIALKILYGRLWRNSLSPAWRESVYYHQALRITGPSAEIREWDGSGKSGLQDFRAAYQQLLTDLDPSEIPPVPIDRRGMAFDGSHRIAAAIVMNRQIKVALVDADAPGCPDADFFCGTSHGHPPIPSPVVNEGVIEFCRQKPTLSVVLVFPRARIVDPAIQELRRHAAIVYHKRITMTPNAGSSLLTQAYLGHEWAEVGSLSQGFADKVKQCFPYNGTLHAIIIDGCSAEELRKVKQRIRDQYGCGNHSVHTSDSHEETLRLAKCLFNENSIRFMQCGTSRDREFHRRLSQLRDWLKYNGKATDDICVDGGTVLQLLRLREARDIDFLSREPLDVRAALPSGIDCHNDQAHNHAYQINEILGDPALHGWYMGVKFCSPDVVLQMKQRRGEQKDLDDVRRIKSMMAESGGGLSERIVALLERWRYEVRRALGWIKRGLKARLRRLGRRFFV